MQEFLTQFYLEEVFLGSVNSGFLPDRKFKENLEKFKENLEEFSDLGKSENFIIAHKKLWKAGELFSSASRKAAELF